MNQVTTQRYDEGYLSLTSVLNQPAQSSPNHHRSSHDLTGLPKLSSSLESPVSHQPLASTVVPSTSPVNREAVLDPKSTKTPQIQATETCVLESSLGPGSLEDHSWDRESPHIKQEPEEEKELTFQSIGLQDITLDDGKNFYAFIVIGAN